MPPKKDKLKQAIRMLVAKMFNECYGANGGDYEGQFENEINYLVDTWFEALRSFMWYEGEGK